VALTPDESASCKLIRQRGLLQLQGFVVAPSGHVGDDDVVARNEAFGNLDLVGGNLTQGDADAVGLLSVFGNLEKRERRIALGL
jgi:hypothetical protein